MNIEIFARCIYVAPEISHNRLAVTTDADGDLFIEYVLFEPSGRERNAYRKKFPAEFLVPGTMYALVEFWDNYLLIEHRAGTYVFNDRAIVDTAPPSSCSSASTSREPSARRPRLATRRLSSASCVASAGFGSSASSSAT